MTAPELSEEERAIVERFEAAEYPPEVADAARPAHADAVMADLGAAITKGVTEVRLRDVLRRHHPIMRSETGPFSGCRCGGVRLGEDVIAHVVGELHAALGGEAA